MAFPSPPTPKSLLGRHRLLAPSAAVKASPLCLGAMNFGDAWKSVLGECNKETSFAMLDHFYNNGGNFIDTAVNYQFGESEQWVGEWMEARGCRDEMIVATKFTGSQTMHLGDKIQQSNFAGNSAKNIHTSFKRSLKQLKTDYIDLLNDLCTAGKVLYLGISDTPAWIVVKANCYARQHGLRQFSVYQGRWGAACRDFERDIIPMCIEEGMALAPWGVLGGGGFQEKDKQARTSALGRTGKEEQAPYVFPIIGGRKTSHLGSNIEALALQLTEEDIETIDGAYGFEFGFPHDFLAGGQKMVTGPHENSLTKRSGYFDFVEPLRPIKPHQGKLNETQGFLPIGHERAQENGKKSE